MPVLYVVEQYGFEYFTSICTFITLVPNNTHLLTPVLSQFNLLSPLPVSLNYFYPEELASRCLRNPKSGKSFQSQQRDSELSNSQRFRHKINYLLN